MSRTYKKGSTFKYWLLSPLYYNLSQMQTLQCGRIDSKYPTLSHYVGHVGSNWAYDLSTLYRLVLVSRSSQSPLRILYSEHIDI